MSLIPEEELRKNEHLNLAPMVDFLFLIIAVLATLVVSRAALYDTEVHMVQLESQPQDAPLAPYEEPYLVVLSVNEKGGYKWISESQEFPMDGVQAVQKELKRQEEIGLLPRDHQKTKVLLHIDKGAKWESIAKLIFAVREAGFHIFPVYESK